MSIKGVSGEYLNVLGEIELLVQYRAETHTMRFVAVANADDLMSGRDSEILGMLEFDQPEVNKYGNNNGNYSYGKNFGRKRKFEFPRTKNRTRVSPRLSTTRTRSPRSPGLDEKNIRVNP